jgi:hypothetical protein
VTDNPLYESLTRPSEAVDVPEFEILPLQNSSKKCEVLPKDIKLEIRLGAAKRAQPCAVQLPSIYARARLERKENIPFSHLTGKTDREGRRDSR